MDSWVGLKVGWVGWIVGLDEKLVGLDSWLGLDDQNLIFLNSHLGKYSGL